MVWKLVFFGVGYLLGARAGRARYEAIMGAARSIAGRDDVQTAAGLALGSLQAAMERAMAMLGNGRVGRAA